MDNVRRKFCFPKLDSFGVTPEHIRGIFIPMRSEDYSCMIQLYRKWTLMNASGSIHRCIFLNFVFIGMVKDFIDNHDT